MDLSKTFELVAGKLFEWLRSFILMLPNLAVAVLVVVLFFLAGRFAKKIAQKILNRFSSHLSVNRLISQVIFLGIFTVGFFIALGILELDKTVTSLMAGVGIVGLILGFAFQDIASNFIAGIIISFEQPFKINDLIKTNDYFGTVKVIRIRTTEIVTPQGEYVIIPNKEVSTNPLTNYSVSGHRRVDLEIGVSYGEDLLKVKKITAEAVKGIVHQDEKKEVEVFFHEFADSSINLSLRFWIKSTSQKDYKSAGSEAIIKVKTAFDQNNIMIPFPIRTLDFGIKGGTPLKDMIKKEES